MSLHLDDDYEEPSPRHSELTLSTGVVAGGIVGLALLCAVFFGLGYSMRRSGPISLPIAAADSASPTTDFSNFKPAAGSPLHPDATPAPAPSPTLAPRPAPTTSAATVPVSPKPASAPAQPVAVPVSSTTSGGFYVQVAAVSHQQDADKLAATLHAEGYLVTARQAPQDALFHVQIGPYATHKEADLIRQKLISEGYNPIVK